MIDEISQLNAGAEPLGSVGLVVGATIGDTGHDLSEVNGPLLAPGLGAQGGDARRTCARSSAKALRRVLPSYSREVLGSGPDVAASAGRGRAGARPNAAPLWRCNGL